jgi:hypothetical protein
MAKEAPERKSIEQRTDPPPEKKSDRFRLPNSKLQLFRAFKENKSGVIAKRKHLIRLRQFRLMSRSTQRAGFNVIKLFRLVKDVVDKISEELRG